MPSLTTPALPLLYNPVAGRGSAGRRVEALLPECRRLDLDVRPEASGRPGDLERRARELSDAGTHALLVAGGDGSLHEVVNGVLASATPAAVGLLPLGTGNDFAKANAIPLHAVTALELLAGRLVGGAAPRLVDAGRLNGRWFANGAGIGFDARVSAIAAAMRRPAGRFVYLLAVLRALAEGVATPRMIIDYDDGRHEGPLTLASFNNGPWVGGLFPIAPMAKTDDGRLEMVWADALGRLGVLRLLPRLLEGRHVGLPPVHHRAVTRVSVSAEAPVPAHLDGENLAPGREFRIELVPAVLPLL